MHFDLKHISLICVILASLCTLAAIKPALARRFWLYANATMSADRRLAVKVSAEIPYDDMIFLKKKELYEAAYELYLKITDENGDLVETAMLPDRIVVGSYEETRSRKMRSKVTKNFFLEPGGYEIQGILMIKHTHIRIEKKVRIEVPDFLSAGIGVTVPRVFAVPREQAVAFSMLRKGNLQMREGIEEKEYSNFYDFDKQPSLQFEVYAETPVGDSVVCEISYEVVDQNKRQLLYGRRRARVSGTGDSFFLSLIADDWEPGAYKFNVRAVLENPHREANSSLRFTIEFNRAMLGKYFSRTLDILSLIASEEELAHLREAAFEERPKAWAEFWKQRDPTPGTEPNEALEEHLRRVRYVNLHFSSLEPGWRTDRGRVYIKFGEPDQVDTTTDPYMQGEYQIWRYFSYNLAFVFYDRFGLGDYRLIQTNTF